MTGARTRTTIKLIHSGTAQAGTATRAPRSYNYDVDLNGRVFLSGTRARNYTNCYRDVSFLDSLFAKLRRNRPDSGQPFGPEERELRRKNLAEGFQWLSRCGQEINFIRPQSTPVVYKSLCRVRNELSFAGSLTRTFEPGRLKLDRSTGRLFHPSPSDKKHGRFSLVSSAILADFPLDLDAGWLEWNGRKLPILPLDPSDLE